MVQQRVSIVRTVEKKLFTQKTKLQGIWFHADANVKKKERKKRKREELKKKEKI